MAADRRKLPIPVTITVYNVLPPRKEALVSRIFRPEHKTDLLQPIKLEILSKTCQQQPCMTDSEEEEESAKESESLLYCCVLEKRHLHPTWDHLDERVKSWNESDSWLPKDAIPHLRITLLQHDEDPVRVTEDLSLDPKLLRRLPDPEKKESFWGEPRPPPKALPPNSILVQFSDGSVRVHPKLYRLLLQNGIFTQHELTDTSVLEEDEQEKRRETRFQDNLFDVLLGDATTDEENLTPTEPSAGQQAVNGDGTVHGAEESTVQAEASKDLHAAIEDLLQEKEALEAMIKEEEELFAHEMQTAKQDVPRLRSMISTVKEIEEEVSLIRVETEKLGNQQGHTEQLIEVQRMKLVCELNAVYPIHCKADEHYFIRGAELPRDIYSGEVDEDEVSAALGFVCHSMVMLSKYLSIPLRYRMVCNSSRSAIQEDGAQILPLFMSRVVERDQLGRGLSLLHRNLECLLKTRDVATDQSHILGKLQKLYESIIGNR